MNRTLATAVALAATTALVLGACSSDDDEDAADTSAPSSTTTAPAPPSTVTDAEFETTVAAYGALADGAGTDACKVVDVLRQSASLPTPANQVQTEQGVGLIAKLFRAAAAAPPAGAEADATALDAAAQALLDEGAANGWDPAWLTSGDGPAAISDPAFGTAFANYQTKAAEQCAAQTGAATTVP